MSSSLFVALITGGGLALASSAHCAVMCGPLSVATRARGGAHAAVLYGAGRLVSYTTLGALAGSVGHVLATASWAHWAEALLSWLMAVLLFSAGLRYLGMAPPAGLVALRSGPRTNVLSRVLVRLTEEPLLLGAATALLPCGALFAAVTAAAALGSARAGATAMGSFAALTGLALWCVGKLGGALTLGVRGRRVLGVLLFAGALVMAVRPLPLLRSGGVPACHAQAAHSEVP